jgi:hypothetical protein
MVRFLPESQANQAYLKHFAVVWRKDNKVCELLTDCGAVKLREYEIGELRIVGDR